MTESGIEVIGDIPWGTHFCQFYQTKEDLIDILVPYFKAGLENNEFCLWIISQPLKIEEATGALRVAVPDIDTYLAKGQLEIKPISLYSKNNTFDSPSVSNNLIETNNHALASGYDGLRLSMNTLWLEEAGHDYLIDSDEKVNNIIGKNSMTVLYTYYLDKCNAIGIIDTFASHQFVLAKKEGRWERINNFGKIKAEETEIKLKEANDNLKILREKTIQCEKAYTLLEKSEKSLAHAQKMTHVGSWGLDIKTDESKWSNEMYHIFGLDPQEFGPSDDTFLQYVHPKDREYVNNAIKEALEGKPYSIDYRIILSNGNEGVIHEQREITFDEENIPVRIVGTIQDIAGRKKIEKALKLARDYNRGLIDSNPDSMFVTDPDSKITDLNKAVEKTTGYLREELIGTDFTNYFTDHEQANENYQEVLRKGQVLNRELEIKHKDGHITPVMYNSSVRLNESGETVGAFATARDITERKKAEQALRKAQKGLEGQIKERTSELEEAYELLLESEIRLNEAQRMALIGNWNWNIKTDEISWSDEIYRIFGRSPQEFGATYEAFLSYVHPDDRDYVNNKVIEALSGKPFSIDHRIVLANEEERLVHEQGEVIFDEKNTPIRMRWTVQDITELKKSEEKIKTLANIVESSSDAIMTVSLDGIVTSWNKGAEQIYGYSAEEILGQNASIIEPDHLKREVKKFIEKIKRGEKVKNYETLRFKKDGTPINVSVTLSPIFDASGKLTAISVIARDITERIKAEKSLMKAEGARKKEIHHRIKNNLQVISSLLDLQADKFNDTKVIEAFRESQSRVISMALIHEELYKEEGTDTLNFSEYLKMLANNLFHTYILSSKNIHLNMDLEENVLVNMDTAVPLGIIVNELVSNSLKHAFTGRDKGEISINLRKEEGSNTFVLTVSDNGIGIPEYLDIEDLDSLGLQLVTSLVDQLDGELELKRNKGTEFTIRFTVVDKK